MFNSTFDIIILRSRKKKPKQHNQKLRVQFWAGSNTSLCRAILKTFCQQLNLRVAEPVQSHSGASKTRVQKDSLITFSHRLGIQKQIQWQAASHCFCMWNETGDVCDWCQGSDRFSVFTSLLIRLSHLTTCKTTLTVSSTSHSVIFKQFYFSGFP